VGYDTWPPNAWKVSGGANAWAGLSVDPKLGMVFAATGSASFDFYGANRAGDNLFADCVLALDARTGKRIWHFQGVKHDLWDLDFPGRAESGHGDAEREEGGCGGADREDGFSFSSWIARRVRRCSRSSTGRSPRRFWMARQAAETQPFPTKPPPFARQTFTEDMVTNRTPAAHAAVLEWLRKLDSGGMFYTAGHAWHSADARHRWRRRMGRRGVRSGDGFAICELE